MVSMSGSMMQTAGILWHVSLLAPPELRALALGLVGLVRVVPILTFSMLSGVVADAADRRKLMLGTQVAMALVAVALAVLTFRGLATLWPIYALAAVGAGAATFDGPARQALIPSLVPREHLPNAISLNMIVFHTASVLGPSLGGLVIAGWGVGYAYALNAASFLVVIASLLLMRGLPRRPPVERARVGFTAAREGLAFVFRTPMIRSTMLLDFFATFFASATALLPIFAQDILAVGATGYGWLYAAPSVGSVAASLVMVALVERIDRRGWAIVLAVAAYGLFTIVFGVSRAFWLTFLCLAGTGAADTVSGVFRNLIRQLETPDHLRGRMVSVSMVFFMGGPQLGELEAGLVANWLGAPLAVVTGGIGALAACVLVAAWTPALRRYRG
jgi:MFS family permease